MRRIRQQVFRGRSARNVFVIAGAIGAVVALAAVLGPMCGGPPARSKPWRHAAAPVPASGPPTSPALADERDRVRAIRERGRALRIHLPADPGHLHPLLAPTEWGLRITEDTVFETLVRYRPPAGGSGAGPGRYEPGLARSWTVSPSGREIRLELEGDVRFHDGRRMTAVDVQFSIDSARHPRVDADHHRRALAAVSAVEILGPTLLRVRLDRADAYVLRELAEVPILPEHVYEKRLRSTSGPLVGTGPYRITSRDDDGVVLERNQDYWGDAPAIEKIVFVREPDAAAALTAAFEGEIDIVPELIPEHYPAQAEAPGVASRFAPLRLRPATVRYLALDHSSAPFDDVRVRRAVAALVDREALVRRRGGLARPIAGPIWPGGPGDGASPGPPAHDPSEAARWLDAAGWRDDEGDGVRERAGRRLMITVLATGGDDPVRDGVLAALRDAGFVLDVRVGPAAVLENRLRAHSFDLAFVEWSGDADRDLAPLLGTGGWLNFGRFSDSGVDALLTRLGRAWEPATRAPLSSELAARIAELWPIVPLTAPEPYGLVSRRVRGVAVWDGWLSIRSLSLE